MRAWIKNTLAVSVVFVAVGVDIAYDQYIKPYVSDTSVLVAATNLNPNQLITAEDVKVEQVPRAVKAEGAITGERQLMGKLAAQVISKGQQITAPALENDDFTLTKGTVDVPISAHWIASVPQSLRRGDHVDISLFGKSTPGTSQQVTNPTGQTDNSVMSNTVGTANVLTDVLVEYVQTNNNEEVVNSPGSSKVQSSDSSRENGTGNPQDVEVKLTEAQWNELHDYILQNYQFYILRTPSTSARGQ